MLTDEQRRKIHDIRIKQAIAKLDYIGQRQQGLINGNFTAVAHNFGLKVRELRKAYNESTQSNSTGLR